MANTLRQARILSSETDTNNTIKQEQNTNVNINIKPPQRCPSRAQSIPLYPNVQPWSRTPESKDSLNQNVNFTKASQPTESPNVGQTMYTELRSKDFVPPMMTQEESQSPSQPPINKPFRLAQDQGLIDLSLELDSLEKKNKFLEMIVQMYELNPLKINSYLVCNSKLLMDMIKLLTDCDKVELVIDDSDVGCGCSASSSKFIKVAKILITKDGKTEDMKYAYNDIYSTFIKYGISLKIVT